MLGLSVLIVVLLSAPAGRYYTNLERRLLELVREARWLGRMGVALPEAARALLPQEAKLRGYYDALTHLLLARTPAWRSLLAGLPSCMHALRSSLLQPCL